ncbi:hypothetical protein F5884DRAFT_207431 [Xylogone sp. PMI_703]|nr:hypothetical protein F5884DRAFT_207431 [Xylogone sp. PMI_703]
MAIGRNKVKADGEGEGENEKLFVASEDEEEDDEEVGDDEYVVEAITNHMIDDETGELTFEVKWEGYEKKSDRTWEPEDNLQTASKILNDYLEKVGGRDHLFEEWEEKRAKAKSAKKRGRPRADTKEESANGSKRGRKRHPASTSPPASSSKSGSFKPPSGSWEDEVVEIDACEGHDGKITVFLTWEGGHRTQHPASQVYHRCPQKMLKFYESHLVFKRNSPADEEEEK